MVYNIKQLKNRFYYRPLVTIFFHMIYKKETNLNSQIMNGNCIKLLAECNFNSLDACPPILFLLVVGPFAVSEFGYVRAYHYI